MIAHLTKCLFVLKTDVTNCACWVVGRSSIMMSYIFLIDLQAITGIAGDRAMNGDHVLWPISSTIRI
jgi:hypothetical protein